MPTTLICSDALIESAREIFSASKLVAPGIDRDERLNRVHAALSCLAPGQPDTWLDLAAVLIAEREVR